MLKSVQEKKEELFKKLESLERKGVKLTQKNLDSIDPKLYSLARELFNNSWMDAKNAYYEYLEITKNPEKNLQRLIVKKAEAMQDAIDISVSKNNKLNTDFVKYIEKNDIFFKDVIFNSFASWGNFYKTYTQYIEAQEPEFTEDEIAKCLAIAIDSDSVLQEDLIAEKYTDIYNAVVKRYGSLKTCLIHLLTDSVHTK